MLGIHSHNRKTQRGGGVAIIYDSHVIDVQELNVIVPYNIEIIWGIGRPKSGKIRTIIIASLYYPPRARKKNKVIDHIVSTIHSLLGNYPDAELLIAGDRNELELSTVCKKVPNLRLIPSGPTYKHKQLDVILTSLNDCYKPAMVVDPIEPDKQTAKPSDHKMVLLYPRDNLNIVRKAEYKTKIVRPLPESRI